MLRALAIVLLLAAGARPAMAQTTVEPFFSPAEQRRILQHGPWPPPQARDASNRVSGNVEAIAFGRVVFFDPRFSANGQVSCATCHKPELHFTDGRRRGLGLVEVDRNTLSLVDAGLQRWLGWSGANDNLWAQSLRPLLDPREMGLDLAAIAARVRGQSELACRYERSFGRKPNPVPDEDLAVDLAKALAAFQETLRSGRSPFDRFRDALAKGDSAAMADYPEDARRGLKIFVGRGNCSTCHFGPNFTNGEFADIGIPFFVARGRVDSGRHGGIGQLRESPYNRLGRHSDDPAGAARALTRFLDRQQRNFGEFRVPALRNVARTAPYMHDGSLASLGDVVRHYSDLNEERLHADGERVLRPLRLSAGEQADLVAFLESLTGGVEWPPASLAHEACR